MMTRDEQIAELAKCLKSPAYFIGHYCQIYDATDRKWIPFDLWPEQRSTLKTIIKNMWVVILKARQLGLTWLVLGFALWMMIFQPVATVLVFSKRDDEAVYLLGQERLRGMFARLPDFLKTGLVETASNDHEWALSNGSSVRAFPTSGGDSYTASLVIIDEADLVPDLNQLMRAVKPTIDAGGRMILLSRSDKSRPQSEFKKIYRAAKAGLSAWAAVFLPWWVRPSRTPEWYEQQKADILSRTGVLDDLHEQYPATDAEALAPKSLDKRIPFAWLLQCYAEEQPEAANQLGIPGMEIYRRPEVGRRYVIGADPAEGNPNSDDSALEVLDLETGEEVATLAGKFEPAIFGSYIDQVGTYYNRAAVLPERNNHGHAVILWLRDNSGLQIIPGMDDDLGWQTSSKSKALAYSTVVDVLRQKGALVHSFATHTQLASIEGATLKAPAGEHDDRAVAFVLAVKGLEIGYSATGGINV